MAPSSLSPPIQASTRLPPLLEKESCETMAPRIAIHPGISYGSVHPPAQYTRVSPYGSNSNDEHLLITSILEASRGSVRARQRSFNEDEEPVSWGRIIAVVAAMAFAIGVLGSVAYISSQMEERGAWFSGIACVR